MAQRVVVRAVALLSAKTKKKSRKFSGNVFPSKATNPKTKTKQHQPHCSLPESAGAGEGSLFLGRFDQGLVGNAESTHVSRPMKAPLVP